MENHLNAVGKAVRDRIWSVLEEEDRAEGTDPVLVESTAYLVQLLHYYAQVLKKYQPLTVTAGGKLQRNPATAEVVKVTDQIRKQLAELALTPASRKKLQKEIEQVKQDEFERF